MKNLKAISLAGIANFITAFGGGAVLGNGINVITLPFIQLDSLVALFWGLAFGLAILFGGLKDKGRKADIWITILGSLSSAGLFVLYEMGKDPAGKMAGTLGVIFFLLLCLRFALWFLSRVLRSDRLSASSARAVPLIEGLFHSGTFISLALLSTKLLPWEGLAGVLILDCLTQGVAGLLDKVGLKSVKEFAGEQVVEGKSPSPIIRETGDKSKFWLGVAIFCLATVWCQVIMFHAAHLLPDFGKGILSVAYLSVAVSGLLGAKVGIKWKDTGKAFSQIKFGSGTGFSISSFTVVLFSSSCILLMLMYGMGSQYLPVLIFTFFAGFSYELFALGVLDQISHAGKESGIDRALAKSFGYLGLTSAVAMIVLRLFDLSFKASAMTVVALLFLQFGLMALLNKRSTRREQVQ